MPGLRWSEIWKTAKQQGISSKETFSNHLKRLIEAGFIVHKGEYYIRDPLEPMRRQDMGDLSEYLGMNDDMRKSLRDLKNLGNPMFQAMVKNQKQLLGQIELSSMFDIHKFLRYAYAVKEGPDCSGPSGRS